MSKNSSSIPRKLRTFLSFMLVLTLLAGIGWFVHWLLAGTWKWFTTLNTNLAIALVAACGTVLASTLAVVIGRYLEGKRERESLHRDKKIAMYDELLTKLLELFSVAGEPKKEPETLVPFLREFQKKLILWSGPKVIKTYGDWQQLLIKQNHLVKSMFKMEDFFIALRKDLGHSNKGIQQGDLIRLMLRNPDLFMQAFKANPDITWEEMVEIEKRITTNPKR